MNSNRLINNIVLKKLFQIVVVLSIISLSFVLYSVEVKAQSCPSGCLQESGYCAGKSCIKTVTSRTCVPKQATYATFSCRVNGLGCRQNWSNNPCASPPSCTNSCPCTAANKAAPWVQGTAPADYIASCRDTTTCSGEESDCDSCSGSKSWYLPNLPAAAPAVPQSISYCINGTCTVLSTNPAAPTLMSVPTSADVVRFRVTPGTLPAGARAWRFNYQLDNLADPLNCGTTGSNGNIYDRCQSNETAVDSTWGFGDMFSPSRSNGGRYSIRYFNGVLRSCTDTPLYEASGVIAYITFNTPPTVVSYTSAVSLSGTEVDTDNGTDRGTTCSDNNPYEFTITYRDVDGSNTINRLGFWIDTVTPVATEAMSSVHGLLYQSGTNWDLKGYACTGAGTGCGWTVNGGTYPGVNTDNRHICSINTGWSDVLSTNVLCSGSSVVGSWTVKSIQRPNSTDVLVTYKVWLDGNLGQNIKIYGLVADQIIGTGWVERGSHTLDFTPPTVAFVTPFTVVGSNSIRLDWSVTDAVSGAAGIHGRARLVTPGVVNGPINNSTSGINNYALDPQDARPLWTVLNPTSRSESIDLRSNEGGVIGFSAHAWDLACNYAESSVSSLDHNEPWAATKGGLLFSEGSINLNSRSIQDDGFYLTRNSALWGDPFRFKIDNPALVTIGGTIYNDIAPSSELYSTAAVTTTFSTFNKAQFPSLGFGASSFGDRKNNKPMFDELKSNIDAQLSPDTAKIPINSFVLSTMTTPRVSQIAGCDSSATRCVFERVGQMLLSSGTGTAPFVCDKPAVFMIDGNLTISTEILKSGGGLNGCMFIASGDIRLMRGIDQPNNPSCNSTNITNSTVCYPPYDTIEAFLMADDQIIIEDNPETLLNEGLLVHGSMVAFGDTNSPAISWQRSLKLASNQRFPSFVIHYDNVYLGIAKSFFEFNYDAFIKDVGYKPN